MTQILDEDTVQVTEPSQQPYQYRIFVNHVNDYIGTEIVETLRNDHIIEINPNIIIGTINKKDDSACPPEIQIIDYENKTQYNTVLNIADIIVFDLNLENLQEFEYILRVIKYMKLENNKTIVCISNLLSWNQTNSKVIKSSDLEIRATRYNYLKQLENLCLNIHNENQKIKGYVVASGIIYGYGQRQLLPYFKQAILQQPPELVILGDGKNFIPMIHLKDLCTVIHDIVFQKPTKKYYLLSDDSHVTQHELIKTISDGLGTGKLKTKSIDDAIWSLDFDLMTLDFKIDREHHDTIKNWHNREGFVKNISKIIAEFNTYRGIKANKIFIGGLPLAGKSTTANVLGKHYNLPIIRIKETIQHAKTQAGELGEEIIKTLDQIKQKMVEQQQKIFEEARKKKKPKKGQPVQEFNPDKIIPRLPDHYVLKIFEWRLSQADCQNKGYVLQGWPKSYEQASQIFKNKSHIPNSYFWIESNEEQIKDRLKKLSPEVTQGTHWTEQATQRRITTFKKINQGKHLNEYFKQHNIDTKKIPLDWANKQQIISFIQRNGPIGFTPYEPLPIPQKPKTQTKIKQQPIIKNLSKEEKQQEFNFEMLKTEQKKLLDEKSKPIRQYLIDNVIPHLTQGLIQVCRKVPKDPLQFLIQFLEQKTNTL